MVNGNERLIRTRPSGCEIIEPEGFLPKAEGIIYDAGHMIRQDGNALRLQQLQARNAIGQIIERFPTAQDNDLQTLQQLAAIDAIYPRKSRKLLIAGLRHIMNGKAAILPASRFGIDNLDGKLVKGGKIPFDITERGRRGDLLHASGVVLGILIDDARICREIIEKQQGTTDFVFTPGQTQQVLDAIIKMEQTHTLIEKKQIPACTRTPHQVNMMMYDLDSVRNNHYR